MRFRIRVSEPTGGLGIRSVLSIFVGPHRRSGRDNPIAVIKSEIAFVRSLSSKKERAASGLFVAEGEKLVGEMLASEFRVRKIFRCGEEDRSEAGSVDTEHVSPKEMERISALKTPTPVLALVELPRYRLSAGTGTDDLALALDGVQDPGNLGTIVRLADWFGIRDIVCSENTADCFGKPFRLRWGPLPACGCTIRRWNRSLPVRRSGERLCTGRFWRGRIFTGPGFPPAASS